MSIGHLFDEKNSIAFDELCFIASTALNFPITALCIADKETLLLKSKIGLKSERMPISGSFCQLTIDNGETFIIEDSSLDERFRNQPKMIEGHSIRSYCGTPLISREGKKLGTICLMDIVHRKISAEQIKTLECLANQAVLLIEKYNLKLEIKQNTEKFTSMINLSPDIISLMTKDGVLFFNSAAAERIHGYTNEEILQKNTLELIHPDDRAQVVEEMSKLHQNPSYIPNVQYRYLNKDGSYVWMEATAINKIDDPLIEGLITISRDISERKRTEQILSELNTMLEEKVRVRSEQLVNSEKIAFIGSHVAELVHNLNGPISILDFTFTHLETKYPDDTRIPKGKIGVKKIINIVKTILESTSIQLKGLIEDVDVNSILSSEIKLLELDNFFRYSVSLTTNYGSVATVKVNPAHLSQCLGNLLKNASEALYDCEIKEIKVRTYQQESNVVIEIKDSGIGIPAENLQKIFDPFYTTKAALAKGNEPSGTGLGLPSVKRMLDSYDAKLEIESTVKSGSTFRILFLNKTVS